MTEGKIAITYKSYLVHYTACILIHISQDSRRDTESDPCVLIATFIKIQAIYIFVVV